MRTEDGWKMIEVGPRIGGFRQDLYEMSFGIDCTANDIAIRTPQKPIITKKVLGHSAAMKIYSKKEGKIQSIKGLKKVQEMESIIEIQQKLKKGEIAKHSKNGGKAVFFITLFNKERPNLLADIRRIEKSLIVEV